MAMLATERPGRGWQIAIQTRIDELEQELTELEPNGPTTAGARIREWLKKAQAALPDRGLGLVDWLLGTRIEYAWQAVHAAERALVQLRCRDQLVGRVPGYLEAAADYLPRDHKATTALNKYDQSTTTDEATLRAKVQALMRAYHRASDDFHDSARRLRNRILGISLSALLAAALLIAVQRASSDVRLVPPPPDAEGVPPWTLLLFVMLAGALGAFISAVPSMIKSRSGGIPYRLPFQQSLLKVAIGPLVAVGGIMLVLGGLAGTTVATLPALLGVAIVFGAGQQFVTGFADRRAAELLKEANKT